MSVTVQGKPGSSLSFDQHLVKHCEDADNRVVHLRHSGGSAACTGAAHLPSCTSRNQSALYFSAESDNCWKSEALRGQVMLGPADRQSDLKCTALAQKAADRV